MNNRKPATTPSPVSRLIRPEYQKILTELAAKQEISEARLIEGAIAIYQLIHSGHSRLVEVNPEPKMAEASPVSREPLEHASDCEGCPDCKPDEICSKCGDYFGDHPKYRGITTCEHKGYRGEPISAEQWLAANFYVKGLGELSFIHKTGCRYFSLPEVLEAYARAAARTCEGREE